MKMIRAQSMLAVLIALTSSTCQPLESTISQAPPNILLIVADDHGTADMSHLQSSDAETPNLDRLALQGVRFNQAYATSPICSPSRMSLITGTYPQRFGTYWYGGDGIHLKEYQTIPELLKKKDYATGYIGKVHYGQFDSDTLNRNFPLNHGFDYFFGHTSARKHYLNHSDGMEEKFLKEKKTHNRSGQSLRQGALWRNRTRVDTVAYTTPLFGLEARKFVSTNRDKPFYLQLSFNAVHNFTHQLPDQYLRDKGLQGYHDWGPKQEDYYEWYARGRYPNNTEGRAHYLGQLHHLDLEVGLLLDHLDSLGLRDNTIVIYVGDNGGSTPIYASNLPLRGSKYLLYEGGIRVPLIISYPRSYKSNEVANQVVSAMDLLPTICSASGLEAPQNIDGADLTPILTGADDLTVHDTLYWDIGHERAIRMGDWKWHEATDDKHAKYEMVDLELGEFLHNLGEDMAERLNLAKNQADRTQAMRHTLHAWQSEIRPD